MQQMNSGEQPVYVTIRLVLNCRSFSRQSFMLSQLQEQTIIVFDGEPSSSNHSFANFWPRLVLLWP